MAAESLYVPVVFALAADVLDSTEAGLGLVARETQIALATEVHPANCLRNQGKTR
jgi:hypothetical protein